MKLQVEVEGEKLSISVGPGYNDICWLACAAVRSYGQLTFPKGNYRPCLLKIMTTYPFVPHPRIKISEVIEQVRQKNGDVPVFQVEVFKHNMKLTNSQQTWINQAFGKERNMQTFKYNWFQQLTKENMDFEKLQQMEYYLVCDYKINKDCLYEFSSVDYPPHFQLPLKIDLKNKETDFDQGSIVFSGEKILPFGEITILYINKITNNLEEQTQNITKIQLNNSIISTHSQTPSYLGIDEQIKKIKEDIKEYNDQMQIQFETQQNNSLQAGEICPFTMKSIWLILENLQEEKANVNQEFLNEELKEEISKRVSGVLSEIYEIFYLYCIMYEQSQTKKDDLVISYQDMMHFLKYYRVCGDSQTLVNFMDFYDIQKTNMESLPLSVSITNGIKFPEFILIIIKCLQYLMAADNIENTNENFINYLDQFLGKVDSINSNEDILNDFDKHMKYNNQLITFLKNNSHYFQNLFILKLQDSNQINEKKYYIMFEEIQGIIRDVGFQGDNVEEVVQTCFQELQLDNFQGFQGVFFYEFLQIIQWISLVMVTDNDDKNTDPNNETVEEGIEMLIEKLSFLLDQLGVR